MSTNPRILGAIGVGAILIAFAYFTAPEQEVALTNDPYVVESKREFIPVGDSDNDGIPDWSERFRQAEVPEIDQEELDSEGLAYTAPETLTGQLAVSLFSGMVEGGSRGPLGPTHEDILNSADYQMQEAATDELYTLDNLVISGENDHDALRAYGNRIAEILVTYLPDDTSRNEIEIIQHAVQSENPDILKELTAIINAYKNVRTLLLTTPTPSSVAQDHLNMTNAFNATLIDLEGMTYAFTDPIYTIVRMQRYYDDITGRNQSIINVYENLDEQGIIWVQEDMVTKLFSF